MKLSHISAWLLLGSTAFAQDAASTLVVRGGRIFDGTGAASKPLGALVIEKGRIRAILAPDAPLPAGAQVVDASDCTVIPGLFDLHAHVAVPGGPWSVGMVTTAEDNLASDLYCGVTSVLDLHGDEATIFALRDASRTSHSMANLYAVGGAFTVPKGHATQFGIPANEVTSPADVDARFALLLPKKPDAIKAILEHGGWGGLPAMPTLSDALFDSIAEHAKAAKLPLFTHVWTLEEALTAVRGGTSALAHGVFLGKVSSELIQEMKARHVAYVPTLTVVLASLRVVAGKMPYGAALAKEALHPDLYAALNDPGAKTALATSPMAQLGADVEANALANLKLLADAGLEIGAGTDAGNPFAPHGPGLIYELGLYVEAGLTPAQALHAATQSSAHILGVADRSGTLEPGKQADLVIVRGDPSASIADLWKVKTVIKGGVVVERSTTQARNAALVKEIKTHTAGVDVPAEIANFDDGKFACPWGGTWKAWSDDVAKGDSTAALEALAEGDAHFLRLKGTIGKGFQWGGWAGGKELVDASNYKGLKLRVRGTNRPYLLTVQCAVVKDYNFFSVALPATEQWSEVEIPFASINQIGYGAPATWTAKDIKGLTIDGRNMYGKPATLGDFQLDIDWIRLY
jgi:imidazolonepropionase-like amidohydrolase